MPSAKLSRGTMGRYPVNPIAWDIAEHPGMGSSLQNGMGPFAPTQAILTYHATTSRRLMLLARAFDPGMDGTSSLGRAVRL